LGVEELEITAPSVDALKVAGRAWPDDLGAGEALHDQP
jgi:hypothetical protein